jgi:hypothetical protein
MVEGALAAGTLVRVLPSPVEMTALWQRDSITSRLVKVIVAEFAQACNAGRPQHQDLLARLVI